MAQKSKNKWSVCDISRNCPVPGYLPSYIKNPSLFNGTINNPASLVTNSMKYSHKVRTRGQGNVTRIMPVQKRIIPSLVNSLP